MRWGLCRGRPRPQQGTLTCASVVSASETSAGEALANCAPRGMPWPSTQYHPLCPLPALGFSHSVASLFGSHEAAVQEGLVPLQQLVVVRSGRATITTECEESGEQERPRRSQRDSAHDVSRIMNAKVHP